MKNKILKTFLIILSACIIGYILFFISVNILIKMQLNGNKVVNIPYKSSYVDEGINVYLNKKDISSLVVIENNVNYDKIGSYKIKYIVKYLGINVKKERIVNVVDNESPIISLKGSNPLYITIGKEYEEEGYDVSDNYDENLLVETKGVNDINTNVIGEYLVEYKATDSSGNYAIVKRKIIVEDRIVVRNGITYVDGILIVNKKYSLPKDYGNGVNQEAYEKLKELQKGAKENGYTINLVSGYRSYDYQKTLYNNYVKKHGQSLADTFSARPGHSEHQTGLSFDVGKVSDAYGETESGIWLSKNAHLYGFIIRYPKGKQEITGYKYEPWHIRYLGVETATKVYESGLCLEEYLNI